MHTDRSAQRNGKPPSTRQHAVGRSELDTLRTTCRRQALVIDTLREAAATLRTGALALKAENEQLRAVDHGEAAEVHFGLDAQAPGAARRVVADRLAERVSPAMRDDAQLVVSELVTNSLTHSGASVGEGVVVRIELTSSMLRLEVEDAGRGGMIGPRAANVETGGGFGLNLVQALSERWGVERVAAGGTRVWAQLARA